MFLIWIQVVVYFIHEFEEYILPGGFVQFFNNKMLGSSESEYPLGKIASFWINIPIIFIGFPLSAYLADSVSLAIGLWTAYFSIINSLSHVVMFFKFGYNPGVVLSAVLNIPIGLYCVYYFHTYDLVSL